MEVAPIGKVTREEMITAIKTMKPGKEAVSAVECAEMIFTGGEVGINATLELCQLVSDEKGMPNK